MCAPHVLSISLKLNKYIYESSFVGPFCQRNVTVTALIMEISFQLLMLSQA